MSAPLVSPEALATALPDSITLHREIRSGGQRAVYGVEVDGERRVLKLMPVEGRDRAEREVRIAHRFDHQGLARVLSELEDVEVHGRDFVYFTEEFVDGTSLDELPKALTLCAALDLALQLIAATEHLYSEHHVVHRDVKPANIMRRPEGTFVLLDVGVGRHQDLTMLNAQEADQGPGTRGYLAPEQLRASKGHELDWRTDQFAIGVVLFEALAGRLPFAPRGSSYRTLLTTGLVVSWDGIPDGGPATARKAAPTQAAPALPFGTRSTRHRGVQGGRRVLIVQDGHQTHTRASEAIEAGLVGGVIWSPGDQGPDKLSERIGSAPFAGGIQAIDPQLYVARLSDANPKKIGDHGLFAVPMRPRDLAARQLPDVIDVILSAQAASEEITHLIAPTVSVANMADRNAQTAADLADGSIAWWDANNDEDRPLLLSFALEQSLLADDDSVNGLLDEITGLDSGSTCCSSCRLTRTGNEPRP